MRTLLTVVLLVLTPILWGVYFHSILLGFAVFCTLLVLSMMMDFGFSGIAESSLRMESQLKRIESTLDKDTMSDLENDVFGE